MRKISWIFVVFAGIGTAAEAGQSSGFKHFDAAGGAALFYGNPGDIKSAPYGDDWYVNARYAAAIGYYWTEHLKTEGEYAISGEGSLYRQDVYPVPGMPGVYPVSVETDHRLEQYSARLVWQFGSNRWVHPYVSGGLVVDRERQRVFIPAQYQYISGHEPVLVAPQSDSGRTIDYRLGYSAGAGAKIYMSQNAFFTTGVLATFSRPAQTLSLHLGIGFDF